MKIAIIGAGAAGIIAAITIKRKNPKLDVHLFDANKSIGKKILASGNGRCNISNINCTETNFIGENPNFTSYALKQFSFKDFEKFCKSIGLYLDIKNDGKVYPLSNEAKSVVSLLENELENLKVKLFLDESVKDIKKDKSFEINTTNNVYKDYEKVLISCGLGAAPQLRASEDGLDFASSFGHSYNITYPSLVGLQTDFEQSSKIQGVKKESLVTLYVDGQKECEIKGDVLFTKYGLSGFAVLDISQYAVEPLNLYQSVQVAINLFPNKNRNEVLGMLESLFNSLKNENACKLMTGMISNKLAPVIFDMCNISKEAYAKDINGKQIRAIVNNLINLRFKVIDTQGFKHAEASGGGVRTAEVDEKTYESKKCKGLYFAGEVLDIVGNRGGYNLQFAWASGYLAGRSLVK